VRAGESTWTQYKTPEGAQNDREEDNSNTEARREFFKRVDVDFDDDGQVDWTDEQFMGSWQERDGFVEIYDENWNLVSRELAPGSGLTFDELLAQITTDESPEAAALFDAAWTQIEQYLPDDAKDTSSLRFTQNEWGELFVFGGDNSEMLLRVNANTHVEIREEPWDDTFGWSKWQNNWFDVQDADWNQIASLSERSFSKAKVADYDQAVEDGIDPENADIWKPESSASETSVRVYKDDVGTAWSTYFEKEYDIPEAVAKLVEFDWKDITSINIGEETQTWHVLENHRDEEDTRDSARVEYFKTYTDLEYGGSWQERVLTIEKRDGYIEAYDENWNSLGRFIDPDSEKTFAEIAGEVAGFADAWDKIADGLPEGWKASELTTAFENYNAEITNNDAIAAAEIMAATSVRFAVDQWDNIQVFNDGLFIGEIHSWSGENTWTNWRGDVVRNEYFGFNFNSVTMGDHNHMDWNHIGGVHGDERYVTDADLGEEYHDESHIRVDFNVEVPADDASEAELAAWDALNPQTASIDWASVDVVRAGESTWTQYKTPEGAQNDREEDNSNTEARREFFKRVDVDFDDDGQVDWTDEQFMGSWQERDGFVEIYDENWNLVSRELAPGSGLTFDELLAQITTDESPEAAALFDATWTQIEQYLPDDAKDTSSLRFTQNEWGELFVFGGDNSEMLLRVNANTHVDFWEEPWDDTFGWTKWESSWFDVQDADWNQIANINQWTRSKTTTEKYDAAEDPAIADIWTKDESSVGTNVRVYKDDVGTAWSTYFEKEYDIPEAVAKLVEFDWKDITSINIGEETQTWHVLENHRDEEDTRDSARVEYFKTYTDLEYGGSWQERVLTIEKRDGYIEAYDENWNSLGRFIDPDSEKTFEVMAEEVAGFADAWAKIAGGLPDAWSAASVRFAIDQWDNIQVFNDGLFIGEIHSWSGENTWTNWRGDDVREEYFGFNFNSVTMGEHNHMDWNHIGGVHGHERHVKEKGVDKEVHEESYIRVDFSVEAPAPDETDTNVLTAWDAFDPQTKSIEWTSVDFVRAGESTWTQYTPEGVEENSNTEERIEFFEYVPVDFDDDGQVDWTDEQFMGSWQERDGFVEIYDENWNLVSRELAPGSGLTFDELLAQITTDESPEAAALFDATWTQIKQYLPDDAKDTSSLRFTQNEWGELFVFGGDNSEMLLRVNANTHVDFWEEPWDDTFGWTKWESSWFDVQDADWNQIANINQWTRSKTTTEKYDAAEDPAIADIWTKDASGDESQIRVYKDDVGITWSTIFKSEYELEEPLLKALSDFSGQSKLTWDDITSISIGKNTHTHHKIDDYRDDDEVEVSDRIEYFTEIEHDGWIEQKRVAILDKRDGIFELRDGDWNFIGEYIDQSSANIMSYSVMSAKMPVITEALDALINYLPIEKADLNGLSFVQTSERDYQIYSGDELIMKSHINFEVYDEDSQGRVHESFYVNFNDAEWNQYGSYYGWKDTVGSNVIEEATTTNFRVDVTEENSSELKGKFGPIESEKAAQAEIVWENVDQIAIGDRVEFRYSYDGEEQKVESSETSSSVEYYQFYEEYDYYEYIGRQEQFGAIIELLDRDRKSVDFDFDDTAEPQDSMTWFGPFTDNVVGIAAQTFAVELQELVGYSLDEIAPVQIDDKSGVIKHVINNESIASIQAYSRLKNNDTEIYWELEFTALVGDLQGESFRFEGQQAYDPELGIIFDPDERTTVKFVWQEMRYDEFEASEWALLVEGYAPLKDLAEFNGSDIGRIRTERIVSYDDPTNLSGVARDEIRTKFFVQDEAGNIVWDWSDPRNIEITESGGIERYYAGDDHDENFLGFALEDGAQLAPITEPIDGVDWFLTKWIETMSPEVLDVHGVDISGHKFRATEDGGIVLVDSLDNVVAISSWSEINPNDYWMRDDVKYAWVGIDLVLESGQQIVVQGNVALDPDGNVLQDTANFMLRPFDEQSWDYDSTSDWDAFVEQLLIDYSELGGVLKSLGLTSDWIKRIPQLNRSGGYERGDGTFAITEARERLDIMNGNDWNQPGHIRIETSDVGYQIFIRDESGDNQLVGGEQTAPITDNGPATAAFGANTKQLIENWFELFEDQIAQSFQDYSFPEDGTLSDSMETPLLPDLESLTITDVDVNGQSETVIINSDGEAVFRFDDSWVDRENEYQDGVWWGGDLIHIDTGFSFNINGRAPTDTEDKTGVLLADSGLMRFQNFDIRVDDFENMAEYTKVFDQIVSNIGMESPVDPILHGRAQAYQRVTFETDAVDDSLNKLSDYGTVDFLEYDLVTRKSNWDSLNNVHGRYLEPLIVEYNSDWNVTSLRINEEDYDPDELVFKDTLDAVNSDLAAVADMSDRFTAALNEYKFADLGMGVIGVYDPTNDDLEAVIFDRGWDNEQAWDIFDINTQEWTGRIRSGERKTGEFEQIWVEADLSDPSISKIAADISALHGLTEDNLPDVSKLMIIEHSVPYEGGLGVQYLGFAGFDDDGSFVFDLGVSNNYRSDDLPDQTDLNQQQVFTQPDMSSQEMTGYRFPCRKIWMVNSSWMALRLTWMHVLRNNLWRVLTQALRWFILQAWL
jgi:hypothetical protein